MIPGLNLSESDEEKICHIFAGWSAHFRDQLKTYGVNGLLKKYETLILSLESKSCNHDGQIRTGEDYQFCCGISYEYINDLSVRDALEILLDFGSIDDVLKIEEVLNPLDQRLRQQQVGDQFFLNEQVKKRYPQDKYWWYYGLPVSIRP